ncbi:MAG TPA: 50S ribosomal protein L11 [Acidimicrobiales bacterium]|jgi:large subunit ribosomal protein L11|nr:50S ribosomal protein L11 [Acidimicrobiales bacterium]
MAKKKVTRVIKLQLPAGKATPAPPVGTALGPTGVSTPDFVKQYNAATEDRVGSIIPVEVTIFEDRSFSFVLKTTPTPALIRAAAGIDKGAAHQKNEVAGSITGAQVTEIAKVKLPDLNSQDLQAAEAQVRGTARSMGVAVK